MCNFGKSASVPQPPALTPQELRIMEQQNLSIQQMAGLLSEGQAQSKETRDILGGLTGLYSPSTVTTPESRTRKFADDQINEWVNKIQQNPFERIDTIVAPEALETLQKAGVDTGRSFAAHGKSKGDVLAKVQNLSSLETVTPGSSTTEYGINQAALSDLRNRLQGNIDFESQIGNAARGDILDWLNREPTEYEKAQQEIGLLQTQRQLAALRGELPLSEGLKQQKADEFNLLKENLARAGNEIRGDSPETAAGLSTAANEALGEFNRTWGLREDTERRGELSSGEAMTLSRYGLASDIGARDLGTTIGLGGQYTPGSTEMGLLSAMGGYNPANLAGSYGNLSALYGGALSPYTNQRSMEYSGLLNQAAMSSQNRAALLGLVGTVGGAAFGGWSSNWGK